MLKGLRDTKKELNISLPKALKKSLSYYLLIPLNLANIISIIVI